MSKLEYYARPMVAFNAENKVHRKYYYDFVQYGGWGTCPVRFICPEGASLDLTSMIRYELIAYYINREFQNEKPQALNIRKHDVMGLTAGGNTLIKGN